MITCPRCRRNYEYEREVCECGQLLTPYASPLSRAAPASTGASRPPRRRSTPRRRRRRPPTPNRRSTGPGTWLRFIRREHPTGTTPAADVQPPTSRGAGSDPDADPDVPPRGGRAASPLRTTRSRPTSSISRCGSRTARRMVLPTPVSRRVAGSRCSLGFATRAASSTTTTSGSTGCPPAGGRSSPRRCTSTARHRRSLRGRAADPLHPPRTPERRPAPGRSTSWPRRAPSVGRRRRPRDGPDRAVHAADLAVRPQRVRAWRRARLRWRFRIAAMRRPTCSSARSTPRTRAGSSCSIPRSRSAAARASSITSRSGPGAAHHRAPDRSPIRLLRPASG